MISATGKLPGRTITNVRAGNGYSFGVESIEHRQKMATGPIVLSVDPDSAAFRFLEAAFQEIEPEVRLFRAADQQEALAFVHRAEPIREQRPDLVLLSTSLPGDTGFELLSEIRSNPKTRDIPVVILLSAPGDVDRYMALGARAFFPNPSNLRDLLNFVKQASSHARLAASRSTTRAFKSTA